MDILILASGDTHSSHSPRNDDSEREMKVNLKEGKADQDEEILKQEVTIANIDENESKLKDRIAQCRDIIESLKLELNEEKEKLKMETTSFEQETAASVAFEHNASASKDFVESTTANYSSCIDSKLNYDENLMEYEKQLQRYQNTLNMAQLEKKNAIRKQMLAKAYRLKLMEVENQCNIELLRVKQSLQCLEPLQMIASKWKNNGADNTYDLNNFELIPRYPELNMNSGSDINPYKDDVHSARDNESANNKEDFVF